jgi:hypothetical protein
VSELVSYSGSFAVMIEQPGGEERTGEGVLPGS